MNQFDFDYSYLHDHRTPQDRRTSDRKWLDKRVREIEVPYYNFEFGIFAYLSFKDFKNFNHNLKTNLN